MSINNDLKLWSALKTAATAIETLQKNRSHFLHCVIGQMQVSDALVVVVKFFFVNSFLIIFVISTFLCTLVTIIDLRTTYILI